MIRIVRGKKKCMTAHLDGHPMTANTQVARPVLVGDEMLAPSLPP